MTYENLKILLNQMEKVKWEIPFISGTHWTDSGDFISQGYKILCSTNISINRKGVAFILNKIAQGSLLQATTLSHRESKRQDSR